MGYWNTNDTGISLLPHGEMVWGDAPADILDAAIVEIDRIFMEDFGRPVTREELIAGMKFCSTILPSGE